MMKIESVASQPDRAGRHAVRFSDGTVMRLYRQTIEDFSIYTGMELFDDEIEQLKTAASAMSAKMRAVRIVAASSISERELEHRLVQKGEDPQQAKAAVVWMSDMQLIDDRKTAEQIVNRCISKGYGLSRAKQMLYEKRVPKQYWEDALAQYPDQSDSIISFLSSRLSEDSDPKEIKRAVDALIRKGHHYGTIRKCLEQLTFDTEDFPEA